jgi:hypothetical protein
MVEQSDSNLELNTEAISDKPLLPISYRVIYSALQKVFPDHATLILHSISKIIVIKKDIESFSTMGVTKEGTLYIAQSFWDKYMHDEEALQTVLMHEMMHCIGNDMFYLRTAEDDEDWQMHNMAHNIAMDARINAYICNMRPEICPENFFFAFYNKEANDSNFLTKLLTPSAVFDENNADEKALSVFHSKFYNTEDFCAHHELYDLVLEILKKQPKAKKLVIKLIGNHDGGTGKGITEEDLEGVDQIEIDTSALDKIKQETSDKFREESYSSVDLPNKEDAPDLSDKIKEAIQDQIGEASAGAGKGSKSAANLIKLVNEVTEKFDLSQFKKMMFDNIFHNVRTQARVRTGSFGSSPIMPKNLSTTDLIMAASGAPPLMWKTRKYSYKMDNNLLPIYLDVSGSTYSYLPRIVKLITNVSNELQFVWGFSTRIEKHTTEELAKGIIKGTGGTDFDCIIKHATENDYKHIVVISDGEAYCQADRNDWYGEGKLEPIPGIKSVVTVLFGYARKNNYFSRAYGNTHMIEEVIV